nr:MAG TPA: hypothetical protein [Caudoviricetes sp.]
MDSPGAIRFYLILSLFGVSHKPPPIREAQGCNVCRTAYEPAGVTGACWCFLCSHIDQNGL